jgi:dipeptidyl aminopeptidase/acylaminoacyl peptidase
VKIASQHPQLDGSSLAAMNPIRYAARDEESVPAYLTLPGVEATSPLPAVIVPHGGPHSRDYWGYDWITQFLAARGYVVLQSNFRGSAGYGDTWSGAGGFRDWRLAINDISDGARHLVAEGLVDPDRICILGWSYGGYAALLSAVEEPALYRCVVSIAGVSDLPTLIDDSRDYLGGKAAREFIGKDRENLRLGSPARRAGEFRAPVLLFHGEEDINVRIRHSEKMAKALRKKKKSVEFIEYPEVEHGIRRSDYRIDMLSRIGAFLDANSTPRKPAP